MVDDANPAEPPLYWGPGGPPENRELVDSWTPGRSDASTWGPYHLALFPPRKVTPWVRFKTMTTILNIARRLWDEREALRAYYQAAHGADPDRWPVRHPGVVLESVQAVAHPACLGCQWLDRRGVSMKNDWRDGAVATARGHQDVP